MGRKAKDVEGKSALSHGVHWIHRDRKQHVYFKEDGNALVCDEDIRDIVIDNPDSYPRCVVKRFVTNVRKYLLVDIGFLTYEEFKNLTDRDFDRILDDNNNLLYELI